LKQKILKNKLEAKGRIIINLCFKLNIKHFFILFQVFSTCLKFLIFSKITK